MILADENVDFRIIRALRKHNVQVKSILEESPGISDKNVIELTRENNLTLLTEDKDFGKWVFSHKQKISVILLRYNSKNVNKIADSLLEVCTKNIETFKGKFTTITEHKIRQRKI